MNARIPLKVNYRRRAKMAMERLGPDAPLPGAMQGRWVDVEDPASELIIAGGNVTSFGEPVLYDYKLIESKDGALSVSLEIEDESQEDSFQRANIAGLVLTTEGEFYAYNVRFASQYKRAAS